MVEVRVEEVSKAYGKVAALKGVSQRFASGAMTAILGPSGCGKTTLLRCIAGFLAVDLGRIRFGVDDVTELPPQQRGTAMVFQNYALWPHMTIFENVAYGLRLQKVASDEIHRCVLRVLELVEIGSLSDVETRRPGALSGGQQQRVALARALVVQPKVLLMDEPLSNLDAKVRQRLRAELRRLQKQVGITAIYVTHDQEEALALADTVVLMNQGQIVQTGTPQDIYLKPSTAFAAEFLGVSNQIDGEAEAGRLRIAGQRVPYAGSERGPVTVIFRASDVQIEAAPGTERAETISVCGELEESLFLGAHYRHYVRLPGAVVMADSADPKPMGAVRIHVPLEKVHPYHA
ncbi:MAG TPA: ABC transporter ATP-binding protein [Candidatus Baltobacteraceae bacterium]|nr:ABC transporter ATP-binding protein [Candidatus Baltobacteraceae bacterium]